MLSAKSLGFKRYFLIDGIGALLTSFFLIAILSTFKEQFGMPQNTLSLLSIIAIVFCVYSICCFFFAGKNWRPFLRIISIANILYCCLTLGLVVYQYSHLTILGITYFVLEIIIVCGLVFFELQVLRSNEPYRTNVHP